MSRKPEGSVRLLPVSRESGRTEHQRGNSKLGCAGRQMYFDFQLSDLGDAESFSVQGRREQRARRVPRGHLCEWWCQHMPG